MIIFFKLRSLLGKLIGSVAYFLPLKENQIAKLHLEIFFPKLDHKKILLETYQNIGQSTFESLNLGPILKYSPSLIDFNDFAKVDTWMASKRGIVCLTAHTGNWDLLAAYMANHKIPLTVIGRNIRNKFLNNFLVKIREKYGVKLLLRADKRAVLEIKEQLTQGNVVAGLIDQDTKVASASTSFFGLHAITPLSLVSIAKKSNSIIVYAFIVRIGLINFKIFVGEIDSTQTVEQILNEYNERLAQIIRQYPGQWVWFHKRWRTLESLKTLSSKEYLEFLNDLLEKKACPK